MRFHLLAAIAILASAGLAARADVVLYTSSTSFSAAATTTTYGFPDFSQGQEPVSSPYTNGPLTFSVLGSSPYYLNVYNDGTYGDKTYLGQAGDTEEITLDGATALGFDIGTYYLAETLTFVVDGTTFLANTPGPDSPTFVGFISDTPITSVSISTADEIDILDYEVGGAATAATPEPSSLALLGTGLLGLVGVVRRRLV